MIKLWDPVTGDQRLTLRGHEGRISTVAFSPDGATFGHRELGRNGETVASGDEG